MARVQILAYFNGLLEENSDGQVSGGHHGSGRVDDDRFGSGRPVWLRHGDLCPGVHVVLRPSLHVVLRPSLHVVLRPSLYVVLRPGLHVILFPGVFVVCRACLSSVCTCLQFVLVVRLHVVLCPCGQLLCRLRGPVCEVTYYSPVTTYSPVTYYSPVSPGCSSCGSGVTYYAPAVQSYAGYYVRAVYSPYVVRGSIYGTPKVYVAGQPVRNAPRALTP